MFEFSFSSDRSINSFKTAIACIIGLIIAHALHLNLPQWVLISIVVVMAGQNNVGGALKKSYMRIAGTLSGALVAGVGLLFFAHDPFIRDAIIIVSCMVFTYVAGGENPGVGTLGAVTVLLVLMHEPLDTSLLLMRPLEIILGILIALLVTRYLFPIHATLRLKQNITKTLENLNGLFSSVTQMTSSVNFHFQQQEDKIAEAFIQQRKLLDEAKPEHYKKVKVLKLYQIMQHQRRLYRAILMLNYTLHQHAQSAVLINALPSYHAYLTEVDVHLKLLLQMLKSKKSRQMIFSPIALKELSDDVAQIVSEQSHADSLYVDAFFVAARLLVEEVKALTEAVGQL